MIEIASYIQSKVNKFGQNFNIKMSGSELLPRKVELMHTHSKTVMTTVAKYFTHNNGTCVFPMKTLGQKYSLVNSVS